jgi:hypothetical protein
MPATETRTLPYRDLVRQVSRHHRAKGELVDFWLMRAGAIVGCYRVRAPSDPTWTDLLPTGVSGPRYQRVIQALAPILFPGEALTIRAIGRTGDQVTIEVEPSATAAMEAEPPERLPY